MILVTGSTGNVGSQLIPALREAGERVRALVHDESKGQPLRDIGAEVVVGDMESPETPGEGGRGVDKGLLDHVRRANGSDAGKQPYRGRQKRRTPPHREADGLRLE